MYVHVYVHVHVLAYLSTRVRTRVLAYSSTYSEYRTCLHPRYVLEYSYAILQQIYSSARACVYTAPGLRLLCLLLQYAAAAVCTLVLLEYSENACTSFYCNTLKTQQDPRVCGKLLEYVFEYSEHRRSSLGFRSGCAALVDA
jgi:hypothetical protein